MSKVSFIGSSADEREMLLGREFRFIDVLDFEVTIEGVILTRTVIGGRVVLLAGDPQESLRNHLSAAAQPGEAGQA